MKNLITIVKKELRRFFTDKRMMMALILPGLLVFILYSIMGNVMANIGGDDDYVYKLRVENEPDGYHFLTGDQYVYLEETETSYISMVEEEKLDIYIVFDVDWSEKLANDEKPTVTFYFNNASIPSSNLYTTYTTFLNEQTKTFTTLTTNLAKDEDVSMLFLTNLLPFLLISFLFSGSIAVAPESIAGEKERGTMASLLITPVKRSTIALGKIIALSLVALVSAASSFLGIVLSLDKIIGTAVSLSIYGFGTYAGLFAVLLSTILVFIVLISLISAYAKSIKEASSLSTPLMIVIMAVGMSTMFGTAAANPWLYLIPVYNSVNVLLTLFSGNFIALPFILTLVANITFAGIGVFALTKMFNSERIMFRK